MKDNAPMVQDVSSAEQSSGAASQLLDREPPENYREEWTRHFAVERTVHAARLQSLLLFRIGDSLLAIPTSVVEVVVEHSAFHSLPPRHGRAAITLANVRGELSICVPLEPLLSISAPETSPDTRHNVHRWVIACRSPQGRLSFPAGEVIGVEQARVDEIRPVPATLSTHAGNYTRGLLTGRRGTAAVLDHELLFGALNKNL